MSNSSHETRKNGVHGSIYIFGLLFVVSGAGVMYLLVTAWLLVGNHERLVQQSLRLNQLCQTIVDLDVALTTVTYRAAYMGDAAFFESYQAEEPKLSQALEEARLLLQEPELLNAIQALEDINGDLVSLEMEVFRLLRNKEKEAAYDLIHSPRYQQNKVAYQKYTKMLAGHVSQQISEYQLEGREVARLYLFGFGVALFATLAAWFMLYRLLVKRQSALEENIELRKIAEGQLRGREQMLKLFVNHTPAAIAMLDKDLFYLQVSNQWLKEYQLEGQVVVGTHLYDHFATSQDRKDAHQRVLMGEPDICDGQMFHSSGRDLWFRWQNYPWFEEDGSVGGMTMFVENITERKLTELALVQAEEKYRRLLKYMPDLVCEIDLEGTFLFYNRSLPGVDPDCHSIYLALPNAPQKQLMRKIERVVEQGTSQSMVVPHRLDDHELWFKLRLAPIYDVGSIERLLLIITDITPQKEAETAMQESHESLEQRVRERTAELEAVNEEVRSFAYIISHDLRAPLVNIRGFVGELNYAFDEIRRGLAQCKEHLEPDARRNVQLALDEDVPEAVEFIESSVTRMDQLITSVLKLSRIGRQELHLQKVEIAAVVNSCLENLAFRIEQEKIQVVVEDLPEVYADGTSMTQIFANILSNAVNYLEPGRPGRLRIWGEKTSGYVWFHVADNGRGIERQDVPKVFEIFRRVGRQDRDGEGMGMAYVKALVQRHGGKITCSSKPGEGTTFTFSIADPSSQAPVSNETMAGLGLKT